MILRPAQLLRNVALAGLAVGWALAAHQASAGHRHADLAILLAIVPISVAAGWPLARLAGRAAGLAGSALALAAFLPFWNTLRQNVAQLYFLQHLGLNLSLAALFGRTLIGPGDALATRIARLIQGQTLSLSNIRYTRQVTVAWTVFFSANAGISILLFALAPIAIWSVFANLLSAPLLGAMFAAEYLWRQRVLPPEEHPSIAAIIRAWRNIRSTPAA